MLLNDQLHFGLGYSTTGVLSTNIFTGAVYNSYQLNIYAQVYDNDKAFAIFYISQPITVLPDFTILQTTINQLITQNPSLSTNIILNEGSYLLSIQEIQKISSLLNEQSLSDKQGLILSTNAAINFPQTFGPLSNYFGVKPVILVYFFLFLQFTIIYYKILLKESKYDIIFIVSNKSKFKITSKRGFSCLCEQY